MYKKIFFCKVRQQYQHLPYYTIMVFGRIVCIVSCYRLTTSSCLQLVCNILVSSINAHTYWYVSSKAIFTIDRCSVSKADLEGMLRKMIEIIILKQALFNN